MLSRAAPGPNCMQILNLSRYFEEVLDTNVISQKLKLVFLYLSVFDISRKIFHVWA